MKRITILFLCTVFILILPLSACNKEASEIIPPKFEILQDMVVQVTYDSYDFDKGAEYLNRFDTFEVGGCSAVKIILDENVYVGRNYDFYCSDSPAFVVRNNAGKYRTIGIGNSPDSLGAWYDGFTISEDLLISLPYLCCDVMSECGIFAETSTRLYEDGLNCSGTNDGAIRRCTQTFMQTMLSNYSTIDEIISHINDYDWFDLTEMGFEQSFLLTDKTGYSVCIEFAVNSWSATEIDYNANFFIDSDYYVFENYPVGLARMSKILSYRPYVRTENDIFKMMELGKYSQFYKADCDLNLAASEYLKELGYTRLDFYENRTDALTKMQEMLNVTDAYTWDELVSNRCRESVFITVANVTDLTLDVHFSEHYGINFTLGFE